MAKLTKGQIGLIHRYAEQCATFKKYWLTYMLGGLNRVASNNEAKYLMIEHAFFAYETAKALGLKDDEILADVVNWQEKYQRSWA